MWEKIETFIGNLFWGPVEDEVARVRGEMLKTPKGFKVVGKCRTCGPITEWDVDGFCSQCGNWASQRFVPIKKN